MTAIVDRAANAFSSWRDTDPIVRSQVLVHAAAIMRTKRDDLCGVVMREAGKTWREADGDVQFRRACKDFIVKGLAYLYVYPDWNADGGVRG